MENKNAYKMVRTTDPDTSVDAAINLDVTKLEKIVLDAIAMFGRFGATMDEIDQFLSIRTSSITPRFKPLIDKGLVTVDGRTKKGLYSNRQQRIHWATEYYQPEKD